MQTKQNLLKERRFIGDGGFSGGSKIGGVFILSKTERSRSLHQRRLGGVNSPSLDVSVSDAPADDVLD